MSNLALGVTATRNGLTVKQALTAGVVIAEARANGVREFHYGRCIGGDEELAFAADEAGFYLVGHPPTDERYMAKGPTAIKPHLEHEPLPYLARDRMIVVCSQLLIACPRQSKGNEPAEGARGEGTWWTIRHGIGRCEVGIIWPDGAIEWR